MNMVRQEPLLKGNRKPFQTVQHSILQAIGPKVCKDWGTSHTGKPPAKALEKTFRQAGELIFAYNLTAYLCAAISIFNAKSNFSDHSFQSKKINGWRIHKKIRCF